jgi:hypothetical protein
MTSSFLSTSPAELVTATRARKGAEPGRPEARPLAGAPPPPESGIDALG